MSAPHVPAHLLASLLSPLLTPAPPPAADSPSELVLTAPCASIPDAPISAYYRGVGCFIGNHYLKACSPSWMHEWIMIEGLRR